MGRKAKYTPEQKIQACIDYLSGQKSALTIAEELKMTKYGDREVRRWVQRYSVNGASSFEINKSNIYTKEFKEILVKEYMEGKGSIDEITAKYDLPTRSTLRHWVMMYNSHIELKDYDPKSEVYMADTLKTTLEERIEIVKYCLEHDRDIKGTAEHFGGNYAQIRQWIIKYEKYGEDGLADKRGKRKKENQLTELEKAQRRIAQLEREKEEFRRKYELLKKAEERERW